MCSAAIEISADSVIIKIEQMFVFAGDRRLYENDQ